MFNVLPCLLLHHHLLCIRCKHMRLLTEGVLGVLEVDGLQRVALKLVVCVELPANEAIFVEAVVDLLG